MAAPTTLSLQPHSIMSGEHDDLIMPDSEDDNSFSLHYRSLVNASLDRHLVMPESDAEPDAEMDPSDIDMISERGEQDVDASQTVNTDGTERHITLLKVDIGAEEGSIFGQTSRDRRAAERFADDLVMPDSDEATSPTSAEFPSDLDSDVPCTGASAPSGGLIMPDSDDDRLGCVLPPRQRPTVHFVLSSDLAMPDSENDLDSDTLERSDLNESDDNNIPDTQLRDIENMSGSKSLAFVIDCNLHCIL